MQKLAVLSILLLFLCTTSGRSQVDEDQLGAWYMYFWNTTIGDSPWGFQGDVQYRDWDILGDMEQLMLRAGLTYQPASADVKFTLGYANVTTGEFGESDATFVENRIYQEALLPHKVGGRFYLTHRFRYEQRWVESQDFRTRYRYMLFLNVPFNKPDLQPGAIYLALYNELFINGKRPIGDGRTVELFDRNRTYMALGYSLLDGLRVQLGAMKQTTDNFAKWQTQLSLHHSF